MRVLVLENFPGATLGLIADVFAEEGIETEIVRIHEGAAVPGDDAPFDGLVLLGGAQSAIDDENHPDLPLSAALARRFGEAEKAVLGICLGAQLVARGHGGVNHVGRPVEFGWRDVTATVEGKADPLIAALGAAAPLFHWHTDTFDLPSGAVHLARSSMTRNQAFRIGRAVYGIQFHFEATVEMVEAWTTEFADLVADFAPDWPKRFAVERETLAPVADRVGRAMARAWVGRLRGK
ncbi:GMP synthase-like glutamine amidotransferase [Rhodobium orientis]|uniref:GMP synthase n=1 Tax=Rhodobium orientis TaxID=34017 RepID=A0A327JG40_9HYPH|nr:type 1 glutamine amidotransferase [Rhodobium orientis]MBB4304132.1 GMP synthase-like glutamine amidotransferase [Rhodobium orientis]MBK5948640.1 GMP synthase [Rhodobium orientis]RAI24901.1 GMP synthase [Rhodobium orientis]